MGKSLNKVQLIGNLGKDPELRYTASGVAVATFSIATSDSWKDQEGNTQERTEWHNIVAWRKLAEICGEWLKKGKKVYIEGRLQTRTYEKDGVKRYVTEIVADDLIMLDGGGSGRREASGSTATQQPATEMDSTSGQQSSTKDDDLPF
jgi:single-strand DNA-binding protein